MAGQDSTGGSHTLSAASKGYARPGPSWSGVAASRDRLWSRSADLEWRFRGPAAVSVAGHDEDLVTPGRHPVPGTVEAPVPDGEGAFRPGGLGQRAHDRALLVEDEDGHIRGLAQADGDGGVTVRA